MVASGYSRRFGARLAELRSVAVQQRPWLFVCLRNRQWGGASSGQHFASNCRLKILSQGKKKTRAPRRRGAAAKQTMGRRNHTGAHRETDIVFLILSWISEQGWAEVTAAASDCSRVPEAPRWVGDDEELKALSAKVVRAAPDEGDHTARMRASVRLQC